MNISLLNPADVVLYERAFFRAFSAISDPTIDDIWLVNRREKRIATRIPYGSQLIYCAQTQTPQIIGAFAMNTDFTQPLQLEMLGFTVDKSKPGQIEVLQIFTLVPMVDDRPLLKVLAEYVFADLASRNISYVYATCPLKRLRFYEEVGLTLLDQKKCKGGTECLIGMEIGQRN